MVHKWRWKERLRGVLTISYTTVLSCRRVTQASLMHHWRILLLGHSMRELSMPILKGWDIHFQCRKWQQLISWSRNSASVACTSSKWDMWTRMTPIDHWLCTMRSVASSMVLDFGLDRRPKHQSIADPWSRKGLSWLSLVKLLARSICRRREAHYHVNVEVCRLGLLQQRFVHELRDLTLPDFLDHQVLLHRSGLLLRFRHRSLQVCESEI